VWHAYLPFIVVSPQRRGHGVGRLLLETKLAELDRAGVPAYLEASSEPGVRLYQRLGFDLVGVRFTLPGGGLVDAAGAEVTNDDAPPVWPMWREARLEHRPANTRWTGWPS
jgi:ribosomal protein S18 acetylase RimI-like enzyme